MQKSREVIREMYESALEEKDAIKQQLDSNLLRIAEIDKYITSITDADADFNLFSPRKLDVLNMEIIEQSNTEKHKLENENYSHYKHINKLNENLSKLEIVLLDLEQVGDYNIESLNFKKKESTKALQVLEVQEVERQRIARDLHDTSLQTLAHIVHQIELSNLYMDKDVIRAKLELASISKNLKNVIEEIRNTIFDLRPMSFDDLGLRDSFDRLFVKLKEANPDIDFVIDIEDIDCDNNILLMTIFRVVKECCMNALHHSSGNLIKLKMSNDDDNCNILIEDNGVGFDIEEVIEKQQTHFGLLVMKERVELLGGKIEVQSIPGTGTKINIKVPLDL